MNAQMDGNELENKDVYPLRKGWKQGLETLFSMLLRKQEYAVMPVRKNIERVIAIYIAQEGKIVVPLRKRDYIRQLQGKMDDLPNYLPAIFTQFVGDLKRKYGIEGADEFVNYLVGEPNNYYAQVFKYYFWRVVLGMNTRNEFVSLHQVRFMEVDDAEYDSYINRIELFEQNEKPAVKSKDDVETKEPTEFVMLPAEEIIRIKSFIENDLINILEGKTAMEYFNFIANLFSQDNKNPYRLSLSSTMIGNIRSFAFPPDVLPYGLYERIAHLNLNNIQLKAFMFIFWMFVKRAPENLYKVYSDESTWPEKHDPVPVMTKYSQEVLDYSTIHWLRNLEETES